MPDPKTLDHDNNPTIMVLKCGCTYLDPIPPKALGGARYQTQHLPHQRQPLNAVRYLY